MIPEPRKAVRMPFERSISSGSRKFSISFDLSNGFSLSSEDLRQSKSKVVVVIGSTFFSSKVNFWRLNFGSDLVLRYCKYTCVAVVESHESRR